MKEKKKKPLPYVNNEKFFLEMVRYKKKVEECKALGLQKPIIPDYIGLCILKIAQKLSNSPNFISYTFKDEMISDGIENCFHRSTKIMTIEHGPIEIEKIVGETVTIKAKDGQWRTAIVKSYGKQMLYKYGFSAFNVSTENVLQTVIATANHRWFVTSRRNNKGLLEYGNKEITDLRIGDALDQAPNLDSMDNEAVLHGLIFGDGSGHKSTVYGDPLIVNQGSRYAFIRVCKQDKLKDEIVSILTNAGYKANYPPHAKGDAIFYIGRFPLVKEVPFTTDPSYIAGFIHGWWLADGNKTTYSKRKLITTSNKDAAMWLLEYAAYAGYHVTSFLKKERKENDGSYKNGKPLYMITLSESTHYEPKVRYIEEYGEDEVFCLEEPVTKGFVLANGLLTGNCILYLDNFDPDKTSNPFAYFTQIIWYAFIRRIQREKKQWYIKAKNLQALVLMDSLNAEIASDKILPNDALNDLINSFESAPNKKKPKTPKGIEKIVSKENE